jgi:protein phosphatase
MRITVAGTTDVGRKRAHNEDAFLLLPEEQLYCVADGMGGHASGEVASRIAVEELAEFFRLTGRDEEATWPFAGEPGRRLDENRLLTGIRLANLRILERSGTDERMRGMGTTLVCAHFDKAVESVIIGHVGDSRAYLLRQGSIRQITEDHSLLNDYMRTRQLTPEEIVNFPHKNVIVRALGMKEQVEVDLQREPLRAGDVILLCCDGLSGMVPDERIAEIIRQHQRDLKAGAQALVDEANAAGGVDNITCVLAQLHD